LSKFSLQCGEFVFPDCKFGLGFDRLDGIAQLVWRATEYRHFTMLPEHNPKFTQLGFSVQLNTKTVNTFKKSSKKKTPTPISMSATLTTY
jgi:hypothetical protein